MNILAIDTAGRTAAVAVMRDDTLLYECNTGTGLTHSETLLPMADAALKACGLRCADIDLFGVTAGPGSFTGLRIGLSAVKGMAFVKDTPCAGVSTLEALAWGMTGEGTVIGALDARRGQVYWAGFDLATHERLTPDTAAPVETLENFVRDCKKPLIFVGDGAGLCYNRFGNTDGVLDCPVPLRVLRGAGVGRLEGMAVFVPLTAPGDSMLFRAGEPVPVHEFHHWDSTCPGDALGAEKPDGRRWRCGFAGPRLYAGFPHLYFAGQPRLAERFAAAAAAYRKEKET